MKVNARFYFLPLLLAVSFSSAFAQTKWWQKIVTPPQTAQQQQQTRVRNPQIKGTNVNVADFDVSGVKLYMTAKEVTQVLTDRYKAREGHDFYCEKSVSSGYYHKDRVVQNITYLTPGFKLTVQFSELFPASDPREAVVTLINYEQVSAAADLDEMRKSYDDLKEAALNKYGPLSEGFPTRQTPIPYDTPKWCTLAVNQKCDQTKPVISLGGNILTMSDNGVLQKQMREAYTDSLGGSAKPTL
jgi:hypothetical protein